MSADYLQLCRPKDEEALARAVLDGLVCGRDSAHQALLGVPAAAFTSNRARDIWEAMTRLYRAGTMPDYPAIERDLLNHGRIGNEDGWLAHLSWLDDGQIQEEGSLVGSVMSLWQRRELYKLYAGQLAGILNPLEDHLEIAHLVSSRSMAIVAGGADDPLESGDGIMHLAEAGMKFREDQEGSGKLAWFGIKILDGDPSEGGVPGAPGHVVILAARPGVGKTALAVQIALNSANHSQDVLFCSLELNRFELWARIAGCATDTKRGHYWAGTYTDFHLARLRVQKPSLNRIKVWDPARPTWSRVESKVRGAALRGVRVVIIDHFSEMDLRSLVLKGGKRFEGAAEAAQRIKALAKELGVCIVLLAQFNREIPRGEMPGSEHLRETGELEQIAYSILALYREAPPMGGRSLGPDAGPPVQPPLKLAVLKNRDGRAGYTRTLSFDGATCRVQDMEMPK